MSIEEQYQERVKEYMSYVRKEIIDAIDESKKNGVYVDDKLVNMPMNSYERALLTPHISNIELIKYIEQCVINGSGEFNETPEYTINGTYNAELKHKLLHIMLRRFKDII